MHAERSSSPTIINFDFSPRLPLSGTVRRIGCSQRNPSLQTHTRKMIAYFFGACMHCTNQFLFLHGLETEGLGQYALFISSILPNDPSKLLALVSDPHIDIDMTGTSGLPSKAVRRLSCCSGSAGFGTLTESVRGCHCPGRYCEIGLHSEIPKLLRHCRHVLLAPKCSAMHDEPVEGDGRCREWYETAYFI